MPKECKECGVPLEGILYKWASRLFGVRPSEGNPEICNKCESKRKGASEGKNNEGEKI